MRILQTSILLKEDFEKYFKYFFLFPISLWPNKELLKMSSWSRSLCFPFSLFLTQTVTHSVYLSFLLLLTLEICFYVLLSLSLTLFYNFLSLTVCLSLSPLPFISLIYSHSLSLWFSHSLSLSYCFCFSQSISLSFSPTLQTSRIGVNIAS